MEVRYGHKAITRIQKAAGGQNGGERLRQKSAGRIISQTRTNQEAQKVIELKSNMTKAEIDKAEKQLRERRAKVLADFKAGRRKSADTIAIKNAIDDMLALLAKRKKRVRK